MHSQRFEERSLRQDEHQLGDDSTKFEGVPCMTGLQNQRVSETYRGQQKKKKWIKNR